MTVQHPLNNPEDAGRRPAESRFKGGLRPPSPPGIEKIRTSTVALAGDKYNGAGGLCQLGARLARRLYGVGTLCIQVMFWSSGTPQLKRRGGKPPQAVTFRSQYLINPKSL